MEQEVVTRVEQALGRQLDDDERATVVRMLERTIASVPTMVVTQALNVLTTPDPEASPTTEQAAYIYGGPKRVIEMEAQEVPVDGI